MKPTGGLRRKLCHTISAPSPIPSSGSFFSAKVSGCREEGKKPDILTLFDFFWRDNRRTDFPKDNGKRLLSSMASSGSLGFPGKNLVVEIFELLSKNPDIFPFFPSLCFFLLPVGSK